VPETRGQSLEQIEKIWEARARAAAGRARHQARAVQIFICARPTAAPVGSISGRVRWSWALTPHPPPRYKARASEAEAEAWRAALGAHGAGRGFYAIHYTIQPLVEVDGECRMGLKVS
jgi:hypothetical protein